MYNRLISFVNNIKSIPSEQIGFIKVLELVFRDF